MANVNKLEGFLNGDIITDKINEIIDWVNGVTSESKVANMSISNNVLTITYFNGSKQTFNLKNTTYPLATADNNGLMRSSDVTLVPMLTQMATSLYFSYDAYLKKKQALEDINNRNDDSDSGGDTGVGDGDGW